MLERGVKCAGYSEPPAPPSLNLSSPAARRHLEVLNPLPRPGDFALFAKLPDDIRRLVWEQALTHERWIGLELRPDTFVRNGNNATTHRGYEIILQRRWRLSKLFRITSESRRVALAFYRVQLPCWHRRNDETLVNGTLYVCPELDIIMLNCLEMFDYFAFDVWTSDHRHIGLVNIALEFRGSELCFKTPEITTQCTSLKEALMRIESLTIMKFSKFSKPSNHLPVGRLQRVLTVPIWGGSLAFDRLPYDSRLEEWDLEKISVGNWDARQTFHRWFRLLASLGVQHAHTVAYHFGITQRPRPDIFDRAGAVECAQVAHQWLQSSLNLIEDDPINRSVYDSQKYIERARESAVGFWLFPMESLGPLPDINVPYNWKSGLVARVFELNRELDMTE